MRTREGVKVARAKGRLRGRQQKLNSKEEAHRAVLVATAQYSTLEVAELFGVARSTVYCAMHRAGAQASATACGSVMPPGNRRRLGTAEE
jgi:DNA invertase Pin-like site-specific DNA recombinase